jgi:DnaJ-class molecular chaperone
VQVEVPKRLSARARELLRELESDLASERDAKTA